MSICRHAKSPFWYASFMVAGKAIFKSTKTTNKTLAGKIEAEMRKQMVESLHFDKKETATLKEVIDFYVDSRRGCGRHANDATYARKLLGTKTSPTTKKQVDVYGFDGSMGFHELKSRDLFRLVTARKSEGNGPSTIIQELLFINGLMKTAKALGYQLPEIDIEAFKKDQKLKQDKKGIRYLSADEEQRLLAELDPAKVLRGVAAAANQAPEMKRMKQDAYDFVVMLLDTGARYTEVSKIEWSQIDLPNRMIRLFRGKVDNESTLYLSQRLYEVLVRRSENKDSAKYVFANKEGGHRNYNPRALQSAIRRAGIEDCSFHTMRKTLASKLVRGGIAISDVSTVLGHSSVATTQTYYASLSPAESSKRAAAFLDAAEGVVLEE